jgi:hypothetical protein
MCPFTDEEFEELPHVLWTSEDNWDPTSLDSVISDDPNWYEAEPSPPLPDPMYDEYGEFRGHVLLNQHEWQVHYFDALDTKTGPDNNDKFHDAMEQFADDPDSVINLVVYRANRARYVCDHETVEAAPKFVMTSEPDYGQLCPSSRLVACRRHQEDVQAYYSTRTHAHEYYTQETIQVSESCLERASP